jgi:putative ABC transport system permease protein
VSPAFGLRYAARSLARGGQRTLLAIGCIAFGVMALVSLQLLAGMMRDAIGVDARESLAGDASLSRGGRPLAAADVAALERLVAEGRLGGVAFTAAGPASLLKQEGTGRVYFLSRALGVDAPSWPLYGELRMRDGARLADTIAEPFSAAVTRDLADSRTLRVGDEITLAGGPGVAPARLRIAGIVDRIPGRQGDTVLYSLETARRIAGRADAVTGADVLWSGEPLAAELERDEWAVRLPRSVEADRERVVGLTSFMLKGAGILGLLIGGIGVSNTMQVMLARRSLEIASLKAIGYDRRHLLALFGLESVLLGVAGSLVGATLAVGLSWPFMVLLGRVGPIMLEWTVDARVVAGGVAVGVATALIFGLHAIVRASAVRPATLFRRETTPVAWREAIGFTALLGALFTLLASVVLGSLVQGAGVVAGGVAGLGLLGLVLWAIYAALVRVPVPTPAIVGMARSNLRRTPVRAVLALVALFCGIFTIGFAGSTIFSAKQRLDARTIAGDGVNVAVHGRRDESATIARTLAEAGAGALERIESVPAVARRAGGEPVAGVRNVEARPDALRATIVEGSAPAGDGEVAVPERLAKGASGLAVGDELELEGADGRLARVRVAGVFAPEKRAEILVEPPSAIVGDPSLVARLGGDTASVLVVGEVEPAALDEVADRVGRALPETLVTTKGDLNDFINRAFENLFAFVVAIASLAILAGGVLIANSVSLAMIERRRELGVLKAIGYTSARVTAIVAIEYAFLGLVAGVVGLGAIAAAMEAINRAQPAAELALDPVQGPVLVAVAIAVALASAMLAAWRPVRLRPLEVLRDE